MRAVSHTADRHIIQRPARKQRPEQRAAHLAMQLADGVHRAAAANRQPRHVEEITVIARVMAPERQQLVAGNTEVLLGVGTQILFDQCRSETVEACRHRRVGGEQVARRQRHLKFLATVVHEMPRLLQHSEAAWPSFRWHTSGCSPSSG